MSFIGSYDFIGINNYGSVYVSASTSSGTTTSPSMTTDAGVTTSSVSVSKHIVNIAAGYIFIYISICFHSYSTSLSCDQLGRRNILCWTDLFRTASMELLRPDFALYSLIENRFTLTEKTSSNSWLISCRFLQFLWTNYQPLPFGVFRDWFVTFKG